ILAIPCIEGTLRLLDIGPDVGLVVRTPAKILEESSGQRYQFNAKADLPYYGRTDLTGPEPRSFLVPKPSGVYRIVVFGGSTVIGFPYAPELSFPRHIEIQLKAQFPERQFEVLNAGMTAINSFAVCDLVRQALFVEPDLVIVHTGHNEFYGPGGSASTSFNLSADLIRWTFRLRRWRLVQWLTGNISSLPPPEDDLLDLLPGNLDIPLDGDVYQRARTNYEANLRQIVELCDSANIPLLFTSVCCNLRDQSPLASGWPLDSVNGKVEWLHRLKQAEQQLANGRPEQALVELDAADKIAPGSCVTAFRRGQCEVAAGTTAGAWKQFRLARDLDGCRFRAPSEFADIVRSISAESDNCHFWDTEQAIKESGYELPPGFDLYFEHVHYNFEGHSLLGRIMAKAVCSEFLNSPWDESAAPNEDSLKQAIGFLPEDDLAAVSFCLEVLETGPFSQSVDLEKHVQFLSQRAAEIYHALPEIRRETFADLTIADMVNGLAERLLEQHVRKGTNFAEELRQAVRIRSGRR
ncbi:MAG: SGNH/GDSL hydrolase family protein, partial [Planctomycetaceae bacterium]|nr:SGNH/GDSL hydrolase family protein [Planctomycetaceae bacterium]